MRRATRDVFGLISSRENPKIVSVVICGNSSMQQCGPRSQTCMMKALTGKRFARHMQLFPGDHGLHVVRDVPTNEDVFEAARRWAEKTAFNSTLKALRLCSSRMNVRHQRDDDMHHQEGDDATKSARDGHQNTTDSSMA